MFKRSFLTFSLVTHNNKWISLSPKMISKCCHCWPDSNRYNATNIDNNNTCNDDGFLVKNTIIQQVNIRQWFHFPYYWKIWVFSFLFSFIFDCLCTNQYHVSLVFFSPLDAYFLLLIAHVHSLATFVVLTIFKWTATLDQDSSYFSHIIASAPSSLINLWQNNSSFILRSFLLSLIVRS